MPYWCALGSAVALGEAVGADDLQDGAEDFLAVRAHVGGDIVEQRRADEKALLVALEHETAPVDDEFGAFVDAHCDIILDARAVRGVDHRAVVRVAVGRDTHPERRDGG